jgi:predicted RNA-binding protein with RPS1 domain
MVKGEIEARHELIRAAMTDMKVGDKIPVKIVKIVRFGAFVETMTGFPGLIHKSKVGDGTLEEWPEELHKIGDVVEATTVKVDRDQRKVAYSLRAAEGGSK